MNITYTGKQGELPPAQQRKLDGRFAKLAKLVERKGEADKGAHVVITTERHLTKAEITMNLFDHSLVGLGSGTDLFAAMSAALDRAEKQALKVREKWRDTKRSPKENAVNGKPVAAAAALPAEPEVDAEEDDEEEAGPRIFRVNHHERRKPMTVDEAMIAIGSRDYMVYRDTDRDCLSVLIRRKDGNFDLVES
jgi:putative sigma-54 modulation protein